MWESRRNTEKPCWHKNYNVMSRLRRYAWFGPSDGRHVSQLLSYRTSDTERCLEGAIVKSGKVKVRQGVTNQENATLCKLLGAITHLRGEDGEIIAKASDGVTVSLGNVKYAPKSLLNYLTAHPTPETW
jgi:hypothetical protein